MQSPAAIEKHLVWKVSGLPGSGKTRQAIELACDTMQQANIPSEAVFFLTLPPISREALAQRLDFVRECKQIAEPFNVQTLDQFCHRLLHRFANQVNLDASGKTLDPDFRLLSELEAQAVIEGLLQAHLSEDDPWRYAAQSFSFAQALYEGFRQLQLADSSLPVHDNPLHGLTDRFYPLYLEKTRMRSLLTHADVAILAKRLVTDNPTIGQQIQADCRLLVMDEAQELNPLQFDLLEALSQFIPVIFCGDTLLHIRGFLGASPEAFRTMETAGQNRLTEEPPVTHPAHLARAFMEHREVIDPELANKLRFGLFYDVAQETQQLAQHIDRLIESKSPVTDFTTGEARPAQWLDVAILLRSQRFRSELLETLASQGIPIADTPMPGLLRTLRRALSDSLQVLQCLSELGWPDTPASELSAETCGLPVLKWQALTQRCNHYLRQWLNHSAGFDRFQRDLDRWERQAERKQKLLLALLEKPPSGAPQLTRLAQQFVGQLATLTQHFSRQQSWHDWVWGVVETLYPQMAEETNTEETDILSALKTRLSELDTHIRLALDTAPRFDRAVAFLDALWETLPGNSKNGVRVLTAHQAQGMHFPYVIVPYLVQDEFPKRDHGATAWFGPSVEDTHALLTAEQNLFALALSRFTEQLWLTCHLNTTSTPVTPSDYFKQILYLKRKALLPDFTDTMHQVCLCNQCVPLEGLAGEPTGKACLIDWAAGKIEIQAGEGQAPSLMHHGYIGQSTWSRMERQPDEALFSETDPMLSLSASSIGSFVNCPRQFFYGSLLELGQTDSPAALRGRLVHAMMEAFNKQVAPAEQNAEQLHQLVDQLLTAQTPEEDTEESLFPKSLVEAIAQLDPVTRTEWQAFLQESIADLESKGYFDPSVQTIQAEVGFSDMMIEGLERCRFSGKLDAIRHKPDGTLEILDYKLYGSGKFKLKKPEDEGPKLEEKLRNLFRPVEASEGNGERIEDKDYKKLLYQLILYYLASRHYLPEKPISDVGVQIIRPAFPDNPDQGAIRVAISGNAIEAQLENILSDIRHRVVDPILSGRLPTQPDGCRQCGYHAICEVRDDVDEGVPDQ